MVSGCVKFNVDMTINSDKSMTLSILEAFNKDLLEGKEVFDNKTLNEVRGSGFAYTKYEEGDYTGYTFTKKIDNIDSISSAKEVKGDLGVTSDKKNLFTVKKGLFKNKYKASLVSSDSESINDSANSANSSNDEVNDSFSFDSDASLDDGLSENSGLGSLNDLSSLSSGMEMTFKVKLPYKVISTNADTQSKDGKELTWNLLSASGKTIDFEFELYNKKNIVIVVISGIALIGIALFVVLKKTGNNDNRQNGNKEMQADVNLNINSELITQNTNEQMQDSVNLANINSEPITQNTNEETQINLNE
jgi:hypothetical protein